MHDEHCPQCERTTPHRVRIEIRTTGSGETERRGTTKYSRDPYRVSVCAECEYVDAERISAARKRSAPDAPE